MSTVLEHASKTKPTGVAFFVNGKGLTATERKLTPRQILAAAGLQPAEQYLLSRDDGDKELTDLDKPEPIREGERFTALFNGPTPVS